MAKADVAEGRRQGVNPDEKVELLEPRRRLRVAEMENEILRGAAPYSARENDLPHCLIEHRTGPGNFLVARGVRRRVSW